MEFLTPQLGKVFTDEFFVNQVPSDIVNIYKEIYYNLEYTKELLLFFIKYQTCYYGLVNLEYADVKLENRIKAINYELNKLNEKRIEYFSVLSKKDKIDYRQKK